MEGHHKKKGKGSTIGFCVKLVVICQLVVIAFLFNSFIPSRSVDTSLTTETPPRVLSSTLQNQPFTQRELELLSQNAIQQDNMNINAGTISSLEPVSHESSRHLAPSDSMTKTSHDTRKEELHDQFHNHNVVELIDSHKIMHRNDAKHIMRQQPNKHHEEVYQPLVAVPPATVDQPLAGDGGELTFPLDLSEEHLCRTYPKVCQCEPLEPKIIIYNRIPKAGSGSMNVFLGEAKKKMPFELCLSKMYHDRLLQGKRAKDYAHNPIQASGCHGGYGPQSILSRHVFYENMTQHSDFDPNNSVEPVEVAQDHLSVKKRRQASNRNFQAINPKDMVYMNVIREPVGRVISRFYYERDARGTFSHDGTIDECMAPNGRCNFEKWRVSAGRSFQRYSQFMDECATNYLSRWFCGMDKVCHSDVDNKRVLKRAMNTVGNGYAFVGLTSEMKSNFKILMKLFPSYFGDDSIPIDICNKCKLPASNSTSTTAPKLKQPEPPKLPPAPKPSKENMERIANMNKLDLELYKFVEAVFWLKAKACGVEKEPKTNS